MGELEILLRYWVHFLVKRFLIRLMEQFAADVRTLLNQKYPGVILQ